MSESNSKNARNGGNLGCWVPSERATQFYGLTRKDQEAYGKRGREGGKFEPWPVLDDA